ncbi:MAG: filamentous hemagglutinin N-terminal domain-containing protein, partial [Methylococcaceae bacterium]|nr:filamentous hemagglutinin N-terminal domain-containing protein [Methylococcaceae bacterium]
MNHIYHSIWNEALGAWIAVSEIATGQGKRSSNRRKLLATSLLICATPVWALPTGDALVAGQATVNTPNAGQMQINQASQNAVINWQGFSIAPNEAVKIQQPNANAALLNRVVGQDASQIQGQLNANGQVYLVNPNGVVFGKTAQVDVGGLVATTHNITNADFMKGNPHFTQDGAKGTVENHGTIKTPEGGVVALIGQSVTNTGTINTPKGTTALAAGKTVDLDFKGDGLVEVKVSEAALNAQITNNGAIQADGGRVVLTAKAAGQLIDTVINQQGIIRAQGLVERNGEIILDGGDNGITQVSGTLDASGNKAGEKGGRVIVTGNKVLIDNTATLNATGNTGGGDILVGGSWQGENTNIRQATATVVKKGATLDASATNKGKGGTVVAWSNIHDPNSATRAWGTFLAKGGVNGGDGGRIETSGHWLNVEGISVNTTTHKGQAGTWLLDPYDVTISNPNDINGVFGTGVWTPTGTGSTVSATTIEAALNSGTSVNITTTGAGVEAGDITVASSINKTVGGTANLFLNADNSII